MAKNWDIYIKMVMNMTNKYEKQIKTLSLRKCARLIKSIEKKMFEEMGKPIEARDMDFITECLDTLDAIHLYVNEKNTAKKMNNSCREPAFVPQRFIRPAITLCLVMALLLTVSGFAEAFGITRWSSKITWGNNGLNFDPSSELHEEYSDGTENYPTYKMKLQEFKSLDEAYERLNIKPLRLPSYMPPDFGEPKVKGYNISYYRMIDLFYVCSEGNRSAHLSVGECDYYMYGAEIKTEERIDYEHIYNFNDINFYVYKKGNTIRSFWLLGNVKYDLTLAGCSIEELEQILKSF